MDHHPVVKASVNSELFKKVENAIKPLRPFLEADGGDVKILEIINDRIVRLELIGACGSCPMSSMTLKAGLEQAILEAVPKIKRVEAINLTPPEN